MPVLKLIPSCTDYLWGGDRLRGEYHIRSDKHPLAEAWVLSCHTAGPCTVAGGPDAGSTLADYIARHGRSVLGKNCEGFADFPILIKFIDAKSDLSIQVHPSNEYALANEGQYGKTEMWYILDCEPGAFLYYGFRREISTEEFARRIRDNTLLEVLNAVPVHKGDVFFIPAGTLHAICRGIVLAEVQQNSNVTYRVYDYGRLGADGKPRALHIPQALAVTECRLPRTDFDFGPHLARCDSFTADLRDGAFEDTCDDASFTSLLVVDGAGSLRCGGETMPLQKGDSLFVTAGSGAYAVSGDLRTLVTRVGTD